MGQKQVFQSPLTDVQIWAANQTIGREPIGTIRMENNAVYKYVAFSGTTTIAAGDVVCYVAFASDGSLVLADGANTALGCGVAMAAVASGTKASGATYYATGWVQIRGMSAVSTTVAGTPTIGQSLTTAGATAPACTLVTAATQQQIGQFYGTKTITCNFPF